MAPTFSSQFIVQPGCAVGDAMAGELPRLASLENPSVPLNSPEAYEMLTDGSRSAAGVVVNESKALAVPALWQGLALISGDVAKLPFNLHQKLPDGDRRKADDHPVHGLINSKPNREMHAFNFWRRMIVHRLLWNRAYALIIRRGDGTPTELLPLLPDRTHAERRDGQLVYVSEIEGRLVPFYPEQIYHLEGITTDNLEAQEFVKSARDAIGTALSAMGLAARFFKHGARVGGILELPPMTKPARDKVEEGFRKTYENNDEAFRTVILREGAKFHEAQKSLRDSQMVDARRESKRDVANYLNVRPSKLGEESTTSYASKSEDNRDYYDCTLSHHTAEIAAEANDKLLTPAERRQGYYCEHNPAALLRMSLKEQAEAWSKLRTAGVLSANEIRGQLNLNRRRDPGGDSYENPNTTSGRGGGDAGASDRLAAAHCKLIAEGLARITAAAAKVVDRVCKTPDDARAWAADKLPEWRPTFGKAIAAAVEAHATLVACHVETETARLAEIAADELGAAIRAAANAADGLPVNGVKATIADALRSFQQQRCPEIAAQLTGANQLCQPERR